MAKWKTTIRAGVLILLAAAILPLLKAEIFYPWKGALIGALEANAWPGMVLALDRENAFAFVLRINKDGEVADGDDFFNLVAELGPHSPDDQYARLKCDMSLPFNQGPATPVLKKPPPRSDTLTLEWSRRDEAIVIGRILFPKNIRPAFVHYFPWNHEGGYERLQDGQIRGRSGAGGTSYLFWSSAPGAPVPSPGNTLTVAYDTGAARSLHFVAGAGDDLQTLGNMIYRYKNPRTIDAFIEEEAAGYEQKRMTVRGLFRGLPEAIINPLHWSLLYQPGRHRLYPAAGRNSILPAADGRNGHWTISGGSSLFNALQLSLESSRLAVDAARAALETQYQNGNIPAWRGRFGGTPDRSQPPVGGFVILKLFQKLGDMDFLKTAYPYLQRWHDFWTARKEDGTPRRDGNRDGLLEWGSDSGLVPAGVLPREKDATGRQRAAWESGQDDLPNWDDVPFSGETGTLKMNCLDLNCLYALDSWCLSEIAKILGLRSDSDRYLGQYEDTKRLVNESLWNENEGFYFDRHWDGNFSVHKAASNFYPFVARIPDETRAQRMLKRLLDPKEFWGDYVAPSVSRDDPAFRADSQQFHRGTIRAPANYLIYQGLKAYGFDAVASEFARKSADLYLRTWKNYQISPEYFNSLTGEAGGDRQQSLTSLLALIGIEEYLDFTPWEGFRFGMLKPDASGRLSRLFVQGRHYEVEVSNSRTVLREEGETIVSVDGSAVIRRFLYNESEVSFQIKSLTTRDVKIRFLKRGKYQLIIDGRTLDVFKGDAYKFEVPSGEHAVLLQLLADLENSN